MNLDPYAELDVPRDATAADVRRAYRAKAKATHPDVPGGDAEKFARTQLALHVLVDPERRQRFDNTGKVTEDQPDNLRASALQVIEQHIGGVINAYVQSGFQPSHDPRFVDLPALIRAAVEADIAKQRAAIEVGQQATEFLRDMARRWTLKRKKNRKVDDDPVAASFNAKIALSEKQLETMGEVIRCREAALEIIAGYNFRHDEPGPAPPSFPQVQVFTFRTG